MRPIMIGAMMMGALLLTSLLFTEWQHRPRDAEGLGINTVPGPPIRRIGAPAAPVVPPADLYALPVASSDFHVQ